MRRGVLSFNRRHGAGVTVVKPPAFVLLLSLLIVLVLPVDRAAAAGIETITQKLERGESVRLAAIGDSITFVCFHTDAKRNYLTLTADALRLAYPKAKIELSIAGNLGVTGTGLSKLIGSVLNEKPDLVFVMFGMNDCAGGPGNLDGYDANLREFVRQIRQAGAEPVILTQNEIVADGVDGSFRSALPTYMERAVEVAGREKAVCVDLFSDWVRLKQEQPSQWKMLLNDAIHPNVAGHRYMAEGILKALWPKAAGLLSTDVRQALPESMRRIEPCLLGGPADKQLLRIDPTTWVAITAGRRSGAMTDLVLWVSSGNARPEWTDFRPVSLVGLGNEPIFASHETPINSGLLLLRDDGRLHIMFTQTIGAYVLTIDTTRPDWWQRLSEVGSYQSVLMGTLPQPESLRGSNQGDNELIDARFDSGGRLEYLLRDLMVDAGRGIVIERYSRETNTYKPTMVLPDCHIARSVILPDGGWLVVGLSEPTGALKAAVVERGMLDTPNVQVAAFELSQAEGCAWMFLRIESEPARWVGYRLIDGKWSESVLPTAMQNSQTLTPVLADHSQQLIMASDDAGCRCYRLGRSGPSLLPLGLPSSISTPWRWHCSASAESTNCGVLWQRKDGLDFIQTEILR